MSSIKDLEILSKYLDEDELKEIAKNAAYDLFKGNLAIGEDSHYKKENLTYYCIQGAMLAMKSSIEPIKSELQTDFNKKVKQAINKLSLFDLQYKEWSNLSEIVNASLDIHRKDIQERIDQIISENYLSKTNNYNDKLYTAVFDAVGEVVSNTISDALKMKYEKNN